MTKDGIETDGVGLVLEGGALRGIFTAGVLDYFMEQGLKFPYVVGYLQEPATSWDMPHSRLVIRKAA